MADSPDARPPQPRHGAAGGARRHRRLVPGARLPDVRPSGARNRRDQALRIMEGPMRLISADCHVNEPPHVFDNVPAKFKDRTPVIRRGADGGDGWSFDGGPPKRTFGIEATAGRASMDKKLTGVRFDEILAGNYDGKAHVADMAQDGVDVSVVYPGAGIFVYIEEDRELG